MSRTRPGQTQGISQLISQRHRSASLPSSWAAWRSDILTNEWAEAAGSRQIISQINARLGDVSFSNIQDLFGEATNSSPNTILSQSAVRSWTIFLGFSLWKPSHRTTITFRTACAPREGFGNSNEISLLVSHWKQCSR